MGSRRNAQTPHMSWRQTEEPYKPNVEVSRDFWPTVSVSVSSNGYGLRRELTPSEAREMASALIDLAAMAETWSRNNPETKPEPRVASTGDES